VAVLTSDNPRDEDPLAIMAEVRAGMTSGPASASGSGSGSTVIVEADRRAAIRRALADAAAGDVVVIAGKGHETYQEVCGQRIPFNDVDEARQALSVHFPSDLLSWRPFPDRGASSGDH
jgi:UDP-N-acetylmuramyl tripeptide synthase